MDFENDWLISHIINEVLNLKNLISNYFFKSIYQYSSSNRLHFLQSFNAKNLMQVESSFACLKHSNLLFKPLERILFFQTSFFLIKCAPFLFKIGKDYNIDD